MSRYSRSDKPDWVPPQPVKLLDQVRERVHYLCYSLQTEKAYVYGAKTFVLWEVRSSGGFLSPTQNGADRGRRFSDYARYREAGGTSLPQAGTQRTVVFVLAGTGHGLAPDAADQPPVGAQAHYGGAGKSHK